MTDPNQLPANGQLWTPMPELPRPQLPQISPVANQNQQPLGQPVLPGTNLAPHHKNLRQTDGRFVSRDRPHTATKPLKTNAPKP